MSTSNKDLEKIVNPFSPFLENCNDVLAGVCQLDQSFFDHSGTFAGHTGMAEMLSK